MAHENNLELIINCENLQKSLSDFKGKLPFDHCIIDNFFNEHIAEEIQSEFMGYEDKRWYFYENSLENKKLIMIGEISSYNISGISAVIINGFFEIS